MFDFSKTDAAKESNYMRPGVHRVKIADVKAGEFPQSKLPYLGITFENAEGVKIEEKFVLKAKDPDSKSNPLSRLQYLHEAWSGKLLDKAFKSIAEMEAYFKKVFVNAKAGTRNLIVGGEINGKVVYGRLPFTGFLVADGEIDLGEFEEGSDEWKKYVKKSTRTTEASGKKGGLLNDADDDDDDTDDLPFDEDDNDDDVQEEAPKNTKKAGAAKDSKPAAKAAGSKGSSATKAPKKKEEEAADDDDADDMPW
jgi:hypothetical protein